MRGRRRQLREREEGLASSQLQLLAFAAAGLIGGGFLAAGMVLLSMAGGGGSDAPDLDLPRVGGGTVTIDRYDGEPVVVAFWATWCGPCRMHMPVLQEMYDDGHHVVAVSMDDSERPVEAYVSANGLTLPVAVADGPTRQAWRARALPTTYVLDSGHQIAAVHRGTVPRSTIEADLD